MKTTKRKVTDTDLYKLLLKINKKADVILKKLDRLMKRFDFLEDEREHDHHHDHDTPEYKA